MRTYSYDFEGGKVRFVRMEQRLWAVATDIIVAMGYKRMSRVDHQLDPALRRLITNEKLLGHPYHQHAVVSIHGVFKLIFGCKFKKARRFGKWLYELTRSPEIRYDLDAVEGALKATSAMVDVVANYDGFDPLDQEDIDANDDNLYTITDIGSRIGVTARNLNQFLFDHNWIYKVGDTYYPTPLIQGKNYCVHRTFFKHDHTRVQHLKWTARGKTAIINLYFKEMR